MSIPFTQNLWTLTKPVAPNTRVVTAGDTIPKMFWNAVEARKDGVWLRQKELGIWRSWTWTQCAEVVRELALGLTVIDFKAGDTLAILANTRAEWVLTDLATLSAGGVVNGVYPTDAASQLAYLCEDSSTSILIVEDEEQLDKALEVRSNLPLLKHIIVMDMDGLQRFNDPMVMSYEALRELGRNLISKSADKAAALLEARIASRGEKDLAILVYTSGTTGKPKGAMHSHHGLVTSLRNIAVLYPLTARDERMCFLPLCHIAERMLGAYSSMYSGAVLNFVENPDTIPENVREIQPTVFFAVPRVWEKFYSGVVIALKDSGKLQQLVYAWSIGVGREIAERVLAQQGETTWLKIKFVIARILVLNNVRKMIGIHRVRYLLTGAAPIAPDLIRWYLALGLPMLEGFGMTESTALGCAQPVHHIKPGTIGKPSYGCEMRIDPANGEILVRGANVFMGYLNLPEKTAETIDAEGWLHTGDVGTQDADGYLKITDRMKDIIITAGGKNITPSELENELKFSPYITDAVVVGDKRAYLTCIIMIDQENIEKFAQDNDVPFSNHTSLTRSEAVQTLIQEDVNRVNKKFARVEQIKKFWLLDVQLSAEDDELTPTMKLKRKLVQTKYAAQIETMYR